MARFIVRAPQDSNDSDQIMRTSTRQKWQVRPSDGFSSESAAGDARSPCVFEYPYGSLEWVVRRKNPKYLFVGAHWCELCLQGRLIRQFRRWSG